MEYQIGKGSRKSLDESHKLKRLKKAVNIAARSTYHKKQILGNSKDYKNDKKALDDFVKKCNETKDFDSLETLFEEKKDIYNTLKSEVAEIASSGDKMLFVGGITSFVSQILSPLPLNIGGAIHGGIRSFFKTMSQDHMGHEDFKDKPEDKEGSIFYKNKTDPAPDNIALPPDSSPDPAPEPDSLPEAPDPAPEPPASKPPPASVPKPAPAPAPKPAVLETDLPLVHGSDRYNKLCEGVYAKLTDKLVEDNVNIIELAEDIHKNFGEEFKAYAQKESNNLLSRYVAALDNANDASPDRSMFIQYAALLEASHRQPHNENLKSAVGYMKSAILVRKAALSLDGDLNTNMLQQFKKDNNINGAMNQQQQAAWSSYLSDDNPQYVKAKKDIIAPKYRAILNAPQQKSLAFLVRRSSAKAIKVDATASEEERRKQGEEMQGTPSNSHFGSVIIEKENNNKYRIRFEDPLRRESLTYEIKNQEALDNILLRLHEKYMNGSPSNNLALGTAIDANIVGNDNLGNKINTNIERATQSGVQCGIHSARRIIPHAYYPEDKDCDTLALIDPNTPSHEKKKQGFWGRIFKPLGRFWGGGKGSSK